MAWFRHATNSGSQPLNYTSAGMSSALMLKAIRLRWSKAGVASAPTTSETITITIIDAKGAAYNTVIYTLDPSVDSTTDVLLTDINTPTYKGDAIRAVYANTDGNDVTFQAVYSNGWS